MTLKLASTKFTSDDKIGAEILSNIAGLQNVIIPLEENFKLYNSSLKWLPVVETVINKEINREKSDYGV